MGIAERGYEKTAGNTRIHIDGGSRLCAGSGFRSIWGRWIVVIAEWPRTWRGTGSTRGSGTHASASRPTGTLTRRARESRRADDEGTGNRTEQAPRYGNSGNAANPANARTPNAGRTRTEPGDSGSGSRRHSGCADCSCCAFASGHRAGTGCSSGRNCSSRWRAGRRAESCTFSSIGRAWRSRCSAKLPGSR